jgi:hypothetical protein
MAWKYIMSSLKSVNGSRMDCRPCDGLPAHSAVVQLHASTSRLARAASELTLGLFPRLTQTKSELEWATRQSRV